MRKSVVTLALLAGSVSSIGQSLNGQPIGHQEEKDHLQAGLKAKDIAAHAATS